MSNTIEIILPNQDLTVNEATIVKWLKKEGDAVTKGEPIVEAESDKATFDVESPANGTISTIIVGEGETVEFGKKLAILHEI